MSIIGGIISGIGSIASSAINAGFNANQAQKTREFNQSEAEKARTFNKSEAEISRNFNASEAEKNRNFQKEMRDTSILSTVEQAKKLGISPSLLLGQGSTQLGGSTASSTTASGPSASGPSASANFDNPLNDLGRELINTINSKNDKLHKQEMQEERMQLEREKMQMQREMHKERLENNLEMAKIRNTNSVSSKETNKRKYTKEQYDNMFDDITKVEI